MGKGTDTVQYVTGSRTLCQLVTMFIYWVALGLLILFPAPRGGEDGSRPLLFFSASSSTVLRTVQYYAQAGLHSVHTCRSRTINLRHETNGDSDHGWCLLLWQSFLLPEAVLGETWVSMRIRLDVPPYSVGKSSSTDCTNSTE